MNAEFQEIKSIFLSALEKPAGEGRAVFLDEACAGDSPRRAQVEALLAAHQATECLLDTPLFPESPDGGHVPVEGPGSQIGPYTLVEIIGEGGMGVVYLAEQYQPVERRVALKIIKPGMDTRAIVVRFQSERQALALMDHPNIARVLDAGATQAGRPFFVMELVEGVSITEYCDGQRLTVRERLNLFVSVCRAVNHAHQKGIIHRDLKPSNILVSRSDDQPLTKVIDFGVSKAIQGPTNDESRFSIQPRFLGTPQYISPEQAELKGLDVDTRSDVYSLGAVLYELLTGVTPLDAAKVQQADYPMLARLIRDEETLSPSGRVGGLGERAVQISAARGTRPSELNRQLYGEVDWVVMKALAKDRSQRYDSPADLASDIERLLAHEPVVAGPASVRYRLQKLLRRQRGPVIAAALLLLALVGGVVGTTSGLVMALAARRDMEWQRDRAILAEADTESARRRTRDALNTLTDDVFTRLLAKQPKLTQDEEQFLRRVQGYYEDFAAEQGNTEEARASRGDGLLRVAQIQHQLGELDQAERMYREAARSYSRLVDDFPVVAAHRRALANIHNNLAQLLHRTGRLSEAEMEQRTAVRLHRALAADAPGVADHHRELAMSQNNLGGLFRTAGRLAEAESAHREALAGRLALARDFPEAPLHRQSVAHSYINLANLLVDLGRLNEAETAYREALMVGAQLVHEYPKATEYRRQHAAVQNNLGFLLMTRNKTSEALKVLREALDVRKELAAAFPRLPDVQLDLAVTLRNLATLHGAMNKPAQAEQAVRESLAILEPLVRDYPSVANHQQELASSQATLAHLLHHFHRAADAEAAYRAALATWQKLAQQEPDVPAIRRGLGLAYNNLGALLQQIKRFDEAEKALGETLRVWEQLVAEYPTVPDDANALAGTLVNMAIVARERKDHPQARRLLERALPYHLSVLKTQSPPPIYKLYYRNNLHALTLTLLDLGDHAAAAAKADELARSGSQPALDAFAAARHVARCIDAARTDDRFSADQRGELAEKYARQAVGLLELAVRQGFQDAKQIKTTDDLAPLRERDDFRTLLKSL